MDDRNAEEYDDVEINKISDQLYRAGIEVDIELSTGIYAYAKQFATISTSYSYQEAVDALIQMMTPVEMSIVSLSEALGDLGITARQTSRIFDDFFRSMNEYQNRRELKQVEDRKQWRADTRQAVPNKSLGHFNRPGNPKFYGKTRRKDRCLREES